MSHSLPSPLYGFGNDPGLGEQIFESSPDCVKILDLQGALISMNRNGQCIMEIDDFSSVCGLSWPSLWPEESHESVHWRCKQRAMAGWGEWKHSAPLPRESRNGGMSW
jgi:hypothetical protein